MTKSNHLTWAVVALCVLGIAAACSSEKTDKPSNIIVDGGEAGASTTGGKSSKGGSTSKGGAVAEGGNVSAAGASPVATGGAVVVGTAGATATAGSSGIGAATGLVGAAGAGPDCEDAAKKCYKCAASTNDQILRHCTDATCIPFDNKSLTKLVDGKLPALP